MIYKKYLLLGVSLCMLNACNESKSVSLEGIVLMESRLILSIYIK